MKRILLLWGALVGVSSLWAQIYEDYVGAGHSEGIVVTSSDNHQAFGWDEIASGSATLDGSGLDAAYMEATRFLSQASLGAPDEMVQELLNMDFEAWIDAQANEPFANQHAVMEGIIDEAIAIWVAEGNDPEDYFEPGFQHVQYAWWQTNMTNRDLLRQRVALAYSEIFVVSLSGALEDHIVGVVDYQDMLIENAFGNYRDILEDITLHPAMGVYLSHLNNPLNIDSLNVHADENYAREIMQLFSIGLNQLNMDGSLVLDGQGDAIPTYDNADIKEFAKVFTGLGPGEVIENDYGVLSPFFGLSRYLCDYTQPMAMYEPWHEPGPKYLLDGYVVPDGQSGIQDIQSALDHLFNHPNVGPFLARRLIQQLVKSNPSPGYVSRVAQAFNDNGAGVRGDMLAVIKAVLLDDEARTCGALQEPTHGKLRSPFSRYAHFARTIDKLGPENVYWNTTYDYLQSTEQIPYSARSVFNFYLPDFQPQGPIADMGLYGPEFEIHNSRTSLGYINHALVWTSWWALMYSWDSVDPVFIDIDELEDYARDPEVLLNELDRTYTHGQLTEVTRENIKTAMSGITLSTVGAGYLEERAQLALYLVLISPDYTILK